jgi:YD repeat-containing protein
VTTDALGRVIASTIKGVAGCNTAADPLCATDLTTTRTYSPATGPLATEQRSSGGITSYTYDGRGRVETISRGPSANDLRERLEYAYDPLTGKKSSERMLARENDTWVEKRRESFAYDTRARLQTVTHADNTTVAYTYEPDGQIATVRDEKHSTANTTYTYDPAGRLASVKQTLAGAAGGAVTTSYAYDLHGNLTSVTDPNGNVTSYTFDDFGQMTTQASPVTGTTTYEYDTAGQLIRTTDANQAVTARTYDALGRTTSSTSTRSGRATETVTWTYDEAGADAFGVGRATAMSDPAGITHYAYERRGLLRSERRTFAGTNEWEAYLTRFTYSADGERASVIYHSGTIVQYQHDYAGRPLGASSGPTALVTATEYLPFGPPTSIAYGNGTRKAMQYDTRYRMIENKLLGPGGGTIAEYDLTWDGAGNVTAVADATDAAYSRTFGYDDLNRLTTANTGTALWGTGAYTYDAMGNMLSSHLGDETVNVLATKAYFTYQRTTPKIATVRNNAISDPDGLALAGAKRLRVATSEVGYRTMTYDNAGNELSYVATRTYSARNLLESVQNPGETPSDVHRVEYGYDGRGVRVIRSERQADGTKATRYWFYTPELQLLAVTHDLGANVWASRIAPNAVPWFKHEFAWYDGQPLVQMHYSDGPHHW